MKKLFLIMIGLIITCKEVDNAGFSYGRFKRCENDEVVCYTYEYIRGSGMSCKFKESKRNR